MHFIFCLFFLLLLFAVVTLIIKPYFIYRSYLKFGKGYFYPLFGMLLRSQQDLQKYKSTVYRLLHLFDDGTSPQLYVENLGTKIQLNLLDVELIKDFFQKETTFYMQCQFIQKNFDRLGGKSFISQNYDIWKKQRKIIAGAFHFDQINKRIPCIEEITKNQFDKLKQQNNLQKQDVLMIFQQITAEIVIQTFISNNSEGMIFYGMTLQQAIQYFANTLTEQIGTFQYIVFQNKYFEWGLTEKDRLFNKQIVEFKQLISNLIQERIQEEQELLKKGEESQKQDLIYYLVRNDFLKEFKLNALVENFISLYLAGMDTTGHLCAMFVYYLSQYEHVKSTLLKEINENKDNSHSSLQHLQYFNACIKEVMRFYGPASWLFPREAKEDHYLKDVFVPKGTWVNILLVSLHRNQLYYEDPHVFKPERWLNDKNNVPFSFLGFSAGRKNCIGQHLAMVEARIILNQFLKTFDFECDSDFQLVLMDKFVLSPQYNLSINLKVKQNEGI